MRKWKMSPYFIESYFPLVPKNAEVIIQKGRSIGFTACPPFHFNPFKINRLEALMNSSPNEIIIIKNKKRDLLKNFLNKNIGQTYKSN